MLNREKQIRKAMQKAGLERIEMDVFKFLMTEKMSPRQMEYLLKSAVRYSMARDSQYPSMYDVNQVLAASKH